MSSSPKPCALRRFPDRERSLLFEVQLLQHAKSRNQLIRRKLSLAASDLRPLPQMDWMEKYQSELQSSVIGKKVMEALKELDKIAYIRFASVYTNFKEIGEFGEYIEELDGKSNK